MALSRSKKTDLVEDYTNHLAAAPHAFLLGYQGITVTQDTELRAKVRENGGSYVVVKNRLALIAVDGKPLEGLKEHFVGPTAVAYSEDDPVSLAKALTDFAKDVPAIQFKGGLLNGQQVAAEEIKDIANLPTREELIAKLLFLLQSPVTRLARTLAAVTRDFVVVLDQVAQKKGEAG
jgi:large subunit ribosomal protein L10